MLGRSMKGAGKGRARLERGAMGSDGLSIF